jgi:beta-N-acetylhexosaminidase
VNGRSLEPIVRTSLRTVILAGALLLASVPAGTVAAPDVEDPHLVAAREALARLSLADRASQVLMTSVPGTTLSPTARTTLESLRPGGVILFGANYRSRAQLTRFVRTVQVAIRAGDATRSRAIVSVDQEGGVVKRIPDAPPTKSQPQLGALDRIDVTTAQGRATADALAALGIDMDLAPVADLDLAPRHVMRARSYGARPALVARHVVAFVTGLQSGGVSASVKHFPGFGGASVNSDDALATITRSRTQLDTDLTPFRRAVAAGTDSVMVSHGVYTAIDRRRPASTSAAAYRLLRGDLGFDGLAITDSLHAAGFAAATHTTIPQGCVRAIGAGADVALLTGSLADAVACRRALIAAVRAGTLSRARLDEAALRVLVAKSRRGLLGS